MAFDHGGDLAQSYDINLAMVMIERSENFNKLHRQAEEDNFLNKTGHNSINRALERSIGARFAQLGSRGVALYEILTSPMLTGESEFDTPNYHDVEGFFNATSVSSRLSKLSANSIKINSVVVVDILKEEAPILNETIDESVRTIYPDGLGKYEHQSFKAGAAWMRTLHMNAEYEIENRAIEPIKKSV